ncbi:Virus attachment protein p12 family protein [Anaerohalosphaera lusitana]|uniref:Virus attachment protein p12 family protein n=1 Tax=Anaerohalosphaera lusitana TaxID=1936003 RepID=A0A1U9NNG1_9BACT|nr:Virus attachment protein p12 family protein [Anaerohalosphaera lusitana]
MEHLIIIAIVLVSLVSLIVYYKRKASNPPCDSGGCASCPSGNVCSDETKRQLNQESQSTVNEPENKS